MSEEVDAICGTCAFWDAERRIAPRGGWTVKECRRHAPTARVVAGNVFTTWPTTTEYQACGDWEQAEDEAPGSAPEGFEADEDFCEIDGWEGTDDDDE